MSRQPPSAAFHKSKTLEGKFIIGDEIGKGAYGRVYKGLDLENGDFVAIKQVSLQNIAQEDLNIIMQEIDLLKNLNHKNIVKYLGSLKTKTDLHIILEYVENGSLANIIKPTKFGPFPESLVSVYISQVLEGLVYLHEQGVIHRDIKGANILTTKEGLVKLADFGVATKLTEADANTHSVVGTPYWMAPEVIEMSGVCAASDVWSVGCTVIELLTCVPPYFDLQPMPALFRIVQDEQPPIPDGLSPGITDFLCQCFKKDARHRPDAKTLLSHPWIQNSRRALQTSLRHSGTIRSLKKKELEESEASNGDDPVTAEEGSMELEATNAPEIGRSIENDGATVNPNEEIVDQVYDDTSPDVPTLAIRQVQMSSDRISTNDEEASSSSSGAHGSVLSGTQEKIMKNDDLESSDRSDANKQFGGKKCSDHVDIGLESQDDSPRKVVKKFLASGEYELNKFSDTPGDASLDDLLPLLGRSLTDHSSAGASTSASSSLARQESAIDNSGKTDLATKLRAAIAKKQRENESGQAHSGDILRLMMGVLKEDGMRSKSLSHFQAVEFSKLVSSLRPDEPEDGIVSACQKLTSFFLQRPEQKIVFVSQHGFLPLVELLEVPKTRVICSALQVLNQIIKDNTDFQVNACLVGLIPITMSFALPDRPYEVRMEAAYFLQQLCQSSLLTLQMFIACRGIPILVGFLEADYAKFRELVHMAIDGMWQIFKLQQSTSRNDFCRIASKNGILLRLINTLYSMSEASRLETLSSGGGFPSDGLAQKPWSGILDPNNPSFLEPDIPLNGVDQPEILRSKQGGAQEPEHASPPQFPESLLFPMDSQKERLSNATAETPGCSMAAGVVNHPPTLMEGDSNGVTSAIAGHQENVRPLLSLLEKEPPSRHFSGQLEFARHLSGLEKQESIRPLLHSSNEKKTNGNMMNEFAEGGRENAYMDSSSRSFLRRGSKKVGHRVSNDGIASTSQIGPQIASGALTGSGVLNARTGSATSSGLLSHTVLSSNADAKEYLEKVADLLLEFAAADSTVKSFMCSQSLLTRLFQMFNKIEPPILLKLLKCINHLSTDPHCLEHLQRADAIKYLIPNLDLKEGPLVSQIHHEVLNAIFNLCKINKRRQEQAAENGIIPHLMHFIMTGSPLKQYALPLLCDMAHASRNSREQLRAHGGLDVYLSLLEDDLWSVTALDSLAICLAHDNESRKVEQALLKKDAIQKLVKFFQFCPEQNFLHILEPFLKIVTKSTRINTTLAVNGLTPLLIFRLDHQDAIARLNLLKLIKAVYEHHPRPKQLIVENDLPQKLQNLIEERRDGQSSGGQVLVKQMATSLLKALHINTVL